MRRYLPIPELDASRKFEFWKRVIKEPGNGCWIWIGGLNSEGYGRFSIDGKIFYTHRIAFMLHAGKDPGEFHVCHKCDNPACVRFSHFFKGTDKDNLQDMFRKGRGHIKPGNTMFIGTKNPRAIVNESKVRQIRAARASGQKNLVIAKRFGIKAPTVSNIVRRATWKHVI